MISRGEGGLVRHTKLTVRWARSLMECWPSVQEGAIDEVIAACLLHDMMKRGIQEDELVTFADHTEAGQCHGLFCADTIKLSTIAWIDLIPEPVFKRIVTAVRDHMGKWTAGYHSTTDDVVRREQEGHIVCITTHMADYAASRPVDHWLEKMNDGN